MFAIFVSISQGVSLKSFPCVNTLPPLLQVVGLPGGVRSPLFKILQVGQPCLMWAALLIPTIAFLSSTPWLGCLTFCRLTVFESVSDA